MPYQEGGTAVVRRLCKAPVDVLHQNVHTLGIHGLDDCVLVTLEGGQHPYHQATGSVLGVGETRRGEIEKNKIIE